MKYVHLFSTPNYVIAHDYIRFINTYFDSSEHVFIFIRLKDIPEEIFNIHNVRQNDVKNKDDFTQLNEYFKTSNKILLHGIFFPTTLRMKLLFQRELMKKLIWIGWGADLYQWKKSDGNKLKNTLINKINFRLRKRISVFVGIFPPDIDFYETVVSKQNTTYHASYVSSLNDAFYDQELDLNSLENKAKTQGQINIQIGHSSSPILNHEEVLYDLEKFKHQNIKIFIPLSYGDEQYANKIEELAYNLFKDKVIVMRELIPKDEYSTFLSEMDIIIFNTNRQIGLGNINPLLYMEKKIYIPKGTVMYDYFHSQGINISDYNKLKYISYDEFIQPIDMEQAKQYILMNELNENKKIQMWSSVFDAPIK